MKFLRNKKNRRLETHGIPEDHYTFAGEIPWCETFRKSGMTNVEFEIDHRTKRVKRTELVFKRKGKTISGKEEGRILKEVRQILNKKKDMESNIERLLKKERITCKVVDKFEEYKEPIKKTFKVLIPVCQNNWESYHSGANLGQHSVTPAKELGLALGLNIGLPSWDLYDYKWERGSITTGYGEPWESRQNFTYLRKDLLDKFLETKRLALIWELWGERFAYFEMGNKPNDVYIEHYYKDFSQIYIYENSKILEMKRQISK